MIVRALICILFSQASCAVTQTGNPSNDPNDGGPDAPIAQGFDLSHTEVLPVLLGDPVTSIRFTFDDALTDGTLRITTMDSATDTIELSVAGGEDTAALPAFTGDWVRVQLLTAAGAAAPQDTQIGNERLLAREESCLETITFLHSPRENAAVLRNACSEELDITVRTRRPASPARAQPSAFRLVAGAEQTIAFTTTATTATYDEFIIESSTGPPERATAVTVHFE